MTTLARLKAAFPGSRLIALPGLTPEEEAAMADQWEMIKAEEADYVNEQRSQSEHDEEDFK